VIGNGWVSGAVEELTAGLASDLLLDLAAGFAFRLGPTFAPAAAPTLESDFAVVPAAAD